LEQELLCQDGFWLAAAAGHHEARCTMSVTLGQQAAAAGGGPQEVVSQASSVITTHQALGEPPSSAASATTAMQQAKRPSADHRPPGSARTRSQQQQPSSDSGISVHAALSRHVNWGSDGSTVPLPLARLLRRVRLLGAPARRPATAGTAGTPPHHPSNNFEHDAGHPGAATGPTATGPAATGAATGAATIPACGQVHVSSVTVRMHEAAAAGELRVAVLRLGRALMAAAAPGASSQAGAPSSSSTLVVVDAELAPPYNHNLRITALFAEDVPITLSGTQATCSRVLTYMTEKQYSAARCNLSVPSSDVVCRI
jgi:hypothetical protein